MEEQINEEIKIDVSTLNYLSHIQKRHKNSNAVTKFITKNIKKENYLNVLVFVTLAHFERADDSSR